MKIFSVEYLKHLLKLIRRKPFSFLRGFSLIVVTLSLINNYIFQIPIIGGLLHAPLFTLKSGVKVTIGWIGCLIYGLSLIGLFPTDDS